MMENEALDRDRIQAELYRIQHHNCNGHAILSPDPSLADFLKQKGCTLCARIIELGNQLRQLEYPQQRGAK